MKDFYKILGVDKKATPEGIKKKFREKALLIHPDKSGQNTKEEFIELFEAYAFIKLLDLYEFQTVDLNKIMLAQQRVMTFKFEIIEIYPGKKYKDTAISELLFAGVGVH